MVHNFGRGTGPDEQLRAAEQGVIVKVPLISLYVHSQMTQLRRR